MKYVVTINDKQYDVEVERVSSASRPMSRSVQRTSAPAPAPAPAKTESAPKSASSVSGGKSNIVSPMPGKILEVKISEGSAVKAGQVAFILEAMKMENEIPVPVDGTVASISVKKGDMVDTDAVLAVLK